uniref:NADH-ubiquinone oxidoreductase chain 4 n=1 Tax=Orancistrocerus aterrimus TaxID=2485977 RepID=A0A3G3FWC2_9HYME|nr:NADH dehydrogenase subunit 4 [Orancistrocerus aterrimus]AYQ18927.1 NADH dehydrogenase subunit 4 [Orancistrocerus aterrimus]
MKFYLMLIFSFGLMNFCSHNLFMICFFMLFMMFICVNLYYYLWMSLDSFFSFDYYSFYLMGLSLFIIGLMLLIQMEKLSMILLIFLLLFLMMSFSTFNLFMFYFMFESSLLPIFMLVIFDGYAFERFEASYYMFMYTAISSLPFLMIILMLSKDLNTMTYFMIEMYSIKMKSWIFMFLIFVFLVKMPMFMFHIWLPKVHVEAPVYGSMILAGVLLKLGSYGILRMGQMFFLNMNSFSVLMITLGLMGGVSVSLVCLVQIDMKILVAYSSVVHMSLLIASLSTLSKVGFIGSYLMMIGHGLCSSGLFFLVNINYERSGSRLMYLNKGSLSLSSTLSMWSFLLCIVNFSAPISLNLIGEIFMLMSLISVDFLTMIFMMIMCFLSAAYSLYLFSFSQHGQVNLMNFNFYEVNMKEYLILFLHWFPLNMLTFSLNMFMV